MSFDSTLYSHGRVGQLKVKGTILQTPLLLPVVSLITGPTPRGGGFWKYVLQADHANGLLRRDLPIMSQVLHFLDFASNNKKVLTNWRSCSVLERYNQDATLEMKTASPLFLDSGGYQLLSNKHIDLAEYGLTFDESTGQKTVLDLQRDFGGDIVATLDYPLPPNLVRSEAVLRMERSRQNALIAAKRIASSTEYKPVLFVAAHGQDGRDIEEYGKSIYQQFCNVGLNEVEFGFAIGSLVPLRGASKISQIVEQIQGLRRSIPEAKLKTTPIHAFGMTGNLIPILAYLGVDTLDSSTYAQEARSLSYMNPKTRKFGAVLEMDELKCDCLVCKTLDLSKLHCAITSEIKNKPQVCGFYKSKYYADIALHNLEMDYKLVQQVQQAIKQDALLDFVVEHGQKYADAGKALAAIAESDEQLKKKLTTLSVPVSKHVVGKATVTQTLSLEWTPEAFDISKHDFTPNSEKTALLVIPCSEEKPYTSSRSHRFIEQRLKQSLNGQYCRVHKVTLSGLYGPVPEEREQDNQILSYDFRLDPSDSNQIRLVAERLVTYIRHHQSVYNIYCAYATSLAYRMALDSASVILANDNQIHLQVFPVKPKAKKMTEFYRHTNVDELLVHLVEHFSSAPKILISE